MIQIASKELANAKYGNKQIAKICKGLQVLWENWKTYYGNPYTIKNLNVVYRSSSSLEISQPLSVYEWQCVFTGTLNSYHTAFHTQYAVIELKNYQSIKPLSFIFRTNDRYNWSSNYTRFEISNDLQGYEISEDGIAWHNMSYGSTINYKQLGINYVRYIRLNMKMMNGAFVDGTTYTCNLTCTSYLKRSD